jgi:hypothetical protein
LNLSGNAYQHAGTGSGATASSRKSGGEFHTCRFAAAAAFVTKPVGGFLVSSGSALNVRRLATSLQRRLSGGVETDAEGITRPGYNAMGGASEEMRCGISCLGHQRDTRGRFRLQRVEIARNLYATHALSRPYERAGCARGCCRRHGQDGLEAAAEKSARPRLYGGESFTGCFRSLAMTA